MNNAFAVLYCARHGGLWPWHIGMNGYSNCGVRPSQEWPHVDICVIGMLLGKHMEVTDDQA